MRLVERIAAIFGVGPFTRATGSPPASGWTPSESPGQAEQPEDVERDDQMPHRVGDIVEGVVTGITDYGAFVDIGSDVSALLFVTDLAWTRVNHPADVLSVGQRVTGKILKFNADKRRFNIGVKQLSADPWEGITSRYAPGQRLLGKVTKVTEFGAFMEVAPGVEGLAPASEMNWATRHISPKSIVQVGDAFEAIVLKLDEADRQMTLSMKRCMPDPWVGFAHRCPPGACLTGKVTHLTRYGAFVEVEGGVEGLIHREEMGGTDSNVNPFKVLRPDATVEVTITDVDEDNRRLRLSLKRIDSGNSLGSFAQRCPPGTVLVGSVSRLAKFGVFVEMEPGVVGLVHTSEIGWGRVRSTPAKIFNAGDVVKVKVLEVDTTRQRLSLSMKQCEPDPWIGFANRCPPGKRLEGVVTNVVEFGVFVDVGSDIEGLVHSTELDRSRVAVKGSRVAVVVLEVDEARRLLKLSIMRCKPVPGDEAARGQRSARPDLAKFSLPAGAEVELSDDFEDAMLFDLPSSVKQEEPPEADAIALGVDIAKSLLDE
ncbi:S1 RNA-binding domain-containing protein [Burkholderia sp. Ac-20365]|uniref:S1 RNA-binding domain-containing protein n=1 Tax=Burkholderia sp. Ac-20365 TaxID=2703897 RepID=UPI00197B54E7|nr:S1 RNA-binding domain-containing protein [Burkholderia sp. Ac-20365]MBN3761014.1 S1 RNA-binding domain-containing protein [Burkholderia sp. Ac-20365]